MMRISSFKVFILLILTVSFAACMKAPSGEESQVTKLIYLTEEYAPLNFTDNGKITGMSVDVVNAIAKVLKIKPQIQVMLWKDVYEKALREPNVIIFSITKIKQREDKFKWLSPSIMKFTEYFYRKNGSKIKLKKLEDAKKYKIGTTTDFYSEEVLKSLDFDNLKSYPTQEKTIKALIDGDIDLIIMADFRKAYLTYKMGYSESDILPALKLEQGHCYIAISKGTSEKVIEEWQKAFNYIRENKTYYKLYEKWFMHSKLYQV